MVSWIWAVVIFLAGVIAGGIGTLFWAAATEHKATKEGKHDGV